MAKPKFMELGSEVTIPILYEDRSVLAIDKPAYWLLVPPDWEKTDWNLQLAIMSSIQGGDFWARSRNIKFLRFIHRLDGETTGIVLFSKSAGATSVYSQLFESRQVAKNYLAVVEGTPREQHWVSTAKIAPDEFTRGKMKIDPRNGKDAETEFTVIQAKDGRCLIQAEPITGRTHQIRVHLAHAGLPVVGDKLYGKTGRMELETGQPGSRKRPDFTEEFPLGLRAVGLSYPDPFLKRRIYIEADTNRFLKHFGFDLLQKVESKPPGPAAEKKGGGPAPQEKRSSPK